MQKQYRVLGSGNLKHDGMYYAAGNTVMLTEEQAAPLLAIGRIEEVVPEATVSENAVPTQPDGFPDRSLGATQPADAPANQIAQAANQLPPQAPAQPTPEQIAHDMEQVA